MDVQQQLIFLKSHIFPIRCTDQERNNFFADLFLSSFPWAICTSNEAPLFNANHVWISSLAADTPTSSNTI